MVEIPKKKICDICKKDYEKKKLKKINHSYRCLDCSKRLRKEHREFLKRDIVGIRKRSDLLKEWEAKRELKESIKKDKIKQIKLIKSNNYFTLTEKQFLFRKYFKLGLDEIEIEKKIKNDKQYLDNFVKDLMKQETNKEEINRKFKEEFSKLIQ